MIEQVIDSNYFVEIDRAIKIACSKGQSELQWNFPDEKMIADNFVSYRVSKKLPFILFSYFKNKGYNVRMNSSDEFIIEWGM